MVCKKHGSQCITNYFSLVRSPDMTLKVHDMFVEFSCKLLLTYKVGIHSGFIHTSNDASFESKRPQFHRRVWLLSQSHVSTSRNTRRSEILPSFHPEHFYAPIHGLPLIYNSMKRPVIGRCIFPIQQAAFCQNSRASANRSYVWGHST